MSVPYPRFTGSEPCRSTDPDIFFCEDGLHPKVVRMLKEICEFCPMRNPCAEYAIVHERYGFWGGMTPRERRYYRQEYRIRLESIPAFNAA